MELNFIYNRFKNSIILLLVFGLIALLFSCSDSLGLDPNVKVTVVDDNTSKPDTTDNGTGNNTGKNTIVKITNTNYRINEIFKYANKLWVDDWYGAKLEQKIELDTANSKFKLNLDVEIENPNKDLQMLKRRDRITRVEFNFKSFIVDRQIFELNGDSTSNYFFKAEMEYIHDNQRFKRSFNGTEYSTKFFIDKIDLFAKTIDCRVLCKIDSPKFETVNFEILLKLFY